MTVIAGYKTRESVVIAADSAATLAGPGGYTILQPTKKLEILNDCIIGASGPVGLAQRASYYVKNTLERNSDLKKENEAAPLMNAFRQALWDGFLRQEFAVAEAAARALGGMAQHPILGSYLVAVPVGDEPRLFEFDQQGSPEEIRLSVPFTSIGSGKLLADTLIGFARHHLWRDRELKTSEAVFTLLWALKEAVRLSPGGLCEPIHIAVLERDQTGFKARLLDDEQQEHEQWVNDFANKLPEALENWLEETMGEAGADRVPNPPSPPDKPPTKH